MRQVPTLPPIALCIGLICIFTLLVHSKSEAQDAAPQHNAIQEAEAHTPASAVGRMQTIISRASGTSPQAIDLHHTPTLYERAPAWRVKEAEKIVTPIALSAVAEQPNAGTVIGPTETDSPPSKEALSSEEDAAIDAKEVEPARKPLGLIFGLRTGIAIPTQKVIKDFGNSTSVAPIVNIEALYALREWVRVGLMIEWHRHTIKIWGPEFGNLNIVSILPTVEFRATREHLRDMGIDSDVVRPYASLGLGVNANSLSKGSALGNASVSFNDTFALRVATGVDFPITSTLALNTEVAWNRNDGGFQLNGTNGSFNASTLNLLFGLRAQF